MIGIGLTWQEVVVLLSFIGAIITVWTKFNVRFSGHDKDIETLKNEIIEHKGDNRTSFDKIDISMKENRIENKEEHRELKTELTTISTGITDLTHTIIKNLK